MFIITTSQTIYPTLKGARIANSRANNGNSTMATGTILRAKVKKQSFFGKSFFGLSLADGDGALITKRIYTNADQQRRAQRIIGGGRVAIATAPLSKAEAKEVSA